MRASPFAVSLVLFLSSTSALADSGSPRAAAFKKSPGFERWLGDAVVFDEQWLDVPGSEGHALAYFLKPQGALGLHGRAALEDAVFLVNAKGEAIAPPLLRTAAPANGCPGPGDVSRLFVYTADAAAPDLGLGRDDSSLQTCLVRVKRNSSNKRYLRFAPEPDQPIARNFPEAIRALTTSAAFKGKKAAELGWSQIPGSDWLVASSRAECQLWLVGAFSARVDEVMSSQATDAVCSCFENILGSAPAGLDGAPTARGLEYGGSGPGTAIPSCDCVVSPDGKATCESYAGRPYSPAMLAQLEEERTSSERAALDEQAEKSAAADRLVPIEQATQDLRFLLAANRDAMVQWKNHDEDAAQRSWTALYRRYVESGRPNPVDEFTAPWEEIAQLLGRPLELKRARADAWVEILNNLGFALWSRHEFHQAKGAYLECAALVAAAGRPRPVLELNLGDVERDLGDVAAARAHYEAFLRSEVPTAQKSRALEELKRLAPVRRSR